MDDSKAVFQEGKITPQSALVKAIETWSTPFDIKPEGVFGSIAIVKSGNVIISSEELDVEFTVPFDDDMEPNEAEITIYNLADNTIKQLKKDDVLTIEAGYKGDTGVLFTGFITKIKTKHDGPDKVTTIYAMDDIKDHTLESISYSKGTKASYILKDLISKTGIPVAVFNPRRDHTYENSETVDGDLMSCIKDYADVCGISVFVSKGKIYAQHIKEGENIGFTVNVDTGMIGSPADFEEEKKAEDFVDIINGYEVEMLLQHRMSAGVIVNLESRDASGSFRVCSGEHRFSIFEAVTTAKMY